VYSFHGLLLILWTGTVCAQATRPLKISEVKVIELNRHVKKIKRYDTFVEIYNGSDQMLRSTRNYFLGTEDFPNQVRLNPVASFSNNRFLRFIKGSASIKPWSWKSYRIRYGIMGKTGLNIENDKGTIYLTFWNGSGYEMVDSMAYRSLPDPRSMGRCKPDSIGMCYYNMATPGRPNKDVAPHQVHSKTASFIALSGMAVTARNTGFSEKAGYRGGWSLIIGQRKNFRTFFTTFQGGLMSRGYSFDTQETLETFRGTIVRNLDGHYQSLDLFGEGNAGVYLFRNLDVFVGVSVMMNLSRRQVFTENRIFTPLDGEVIEETFDNDMDIEFDYTPDLGLTAGMNYQLNPAFDLRAAWQYSFSTLEEGSLFDNSESIFFHAWMLGIAYRINHLPKSYRDYVLSR